MSEKSPSGVRSIWLALGGAAFGIVGVCALIFVVTALGLLWLASPKSSSDDDPPTATTVQQVVTATDVPALVGPTPLPVIVPTAVSSIPTSSVTLPSPADAVRNYYNLVSQQRL